MAIGTPGIAICIPFDAFKGTFQLTEGKEQSDYNAFVSEIDLILHKHYREKFLGVLICADSKDAKETIANVFPYSYQPEKEVYFAAIREAAAKLKLTFTV